jgi:hypothetical protein
MITAQIASLSQRADSLKQTIESLLPQVDSIFVGLNNYSETPSFCHNDKIKCKLFDNSTGDAVKFYGVENIEGYIFTCDDDLIYPPDYVKYLTKMIDHYQKAAIVTVHGRDFYRFPIVNYYSSATIRYRCLDTVERDEIVLVGGTGVMAWHSSTVKVKYSDFQAPNMADVWMAKLAHEQDVPIVVLNHPAGWLRYIHPETTIYESYRSNCTLQTEIINQILLSRNE